MIQTRVTAAIDAKKRCRSLYTHKIRRQDHMSSAIRAKLIVCLAYAAQWSDEMLKSEAERLIRRSLEETNAQFTEEQIQALCIIVTKIAATTVEEALASWRPSSGGNPKFYA